MAQESGVRGQVAGSGRQGVVDWEDCRMNGMAAFWRAMGQLEAEVVVLRNRVEEVECLVSEKVALRLLCDLLAERGRGRRRGGKNEGDGVVCRVCGQAVEDADYWWGDRCVRCALGEASSVDRVDERRG